MPPLSGLYASAWGEGRENFTTSNFSVQESKRNCQKSPSSPTPQQCFRGQHFSRMTRVPHSGAPSPAAPPGASPSPAGPGWKAARSHLCLLFHPPPLISRPSPRPIKGAARCGALALNSVTFFGFFPPGQGASELSEEGVIFLPRRGRFGGRRLGGRRRFLRRGRHGGGSHETAPEPGRGSENAEASLDSATSGSSLFPTETELFQASEAVLGLAPSLPPSVLLPSLPRTPREGVFLPLANTRRVCSAPWRAAAALFLRPQSLRVWPTNCPASSADPQVDGPSWKDAAAWILCKHTGKTSRCPVPAKA